MPPRGCLKSSAIIASFPVSGRSSVFIYHNGCSVEEPGRSSHLSSAMFLFTTPPTRPQQDVPVVDAIRQGAARTGTQFEYLLSTARRESALDPQARARNSSASGLFQFIEQTWLGLVKSEGAQAGLTDYAKAV